MSVALPTLNFAGMSLGDDQSQVTGVTMGTGVSSLCTARKTQWLTYAGKVLRFYAYFNEAVSQSATETDRVRLCTLFYYLENDTIQVNEPRVENSGIVGGTLVRRSVIDNPESGEPYRIVLPAEGAELSSDIFVGADIFIHGISHHIFDCDSFTRETMAALGLPQNRAEPAPTDKFTANRALAGAVSAKHPKAGLMDEPRVPRMLPQDDTSMLCYHCQWDDTASDYGEMHTYKLCLYLEDQTIELKETVRPPPPTKGARARPTGAAAARQHFSVLLKRQRIPKSSMTSVDKIGERSVAPADDYLCADDLLVGTTISLQGRPLRVLGCDAATQKWWQERGVDTDKLGLGSSAEAPRPTPIGGRPAKSYDHLKKEEEAAAAPAVSKRDAFRKHAALSGKTLRFSACLASQLATRDQEKLEFIINYFPGDDALTVYTHAPANSGLMGGLFLKKSQPTNPATGAFYRPQDLGVGAIVDLPNAKLCVTKMDDFTANFLAGKVVTVMKVDHVFQKLQEKMRLSGTPHDMFLHSFDPSHTGLVRPEDFEVALNILFEEFVLPPRQMQRLFGYFDRAGKGHFDFNDFVTVLEQEVDIPDGEGEGGSDGVPEVNEATLTAHEIDTYVRFVHSQELTGKQEVQLARAMRTLMDYFASLRDEAQFQALFQTTKLDPGKTHKLDEQQFSDVLREKAHLTERDTKMILAKLMPGSPTTAGTINYVNFYAIFTQYIQHKKTGQNLGP